ncbi:hypothetical protein [Vulcanisaeta sp. JCM 16159]|uniref:hypothetical protein n=1 Tax=Vulcanisaeta sp. JCM 16159 TaxID=1295371 RepID=UPI0006D0F521|nr:hypothetical protein [Vulcanisaeta sp. JCM 16159]
MRIKPNPDKVVECIIDRAKRLGRITKLAEVARKAAPKGSEKVIETVEEYLAGIPCDEVLALVLEYVDLYMCYCEYEGEDIKILIKILRMKCDELRRELADYIMDFLAIITNNDVIGEAAQILWERDVLVHEDFTMRRGKGLNPP